MNAGFTELYDIFVIRIKAMQIRLMPFQKILEVVSEEKGIISQELDQKYVLSILEEDTEAMSIIESKRRYLNELPNLIEQGLLES